MPRYLIWVPSDRLDNVKIDYRLSSRAQLRIVAALETLPSEMEKAKAYYARVPLSCADGSTYVLFGRREQFGSRVEVELRVIETSGSAAAERIRAECKTIEGAYRWWRKAVRSNQIVASATADQDTLLRRRRA